MLLRAPLIRLIWLLAVPAWIGCAAAHPLKGVPAQEFGSDQRALHRSGRDTLDLALLGQPTPPEHYVDSGDVLGIFIDGVLGSSQSEQAIPVYQPNDRELSPSTGFPIPVRSDGTISLPLIDPLPVRGLTLMQVEDLIRRTYTIDKPLLQPGRDKILVSLQKPRTYRVLVIRQEAGSGQGNVGASDEEMGSREKRGSGRLVLLPAYRNDVLNALTETGGLPGLDARNTIYVIRRGGAASMTAPAALPPPAPTDENAAAASTRPRSPIRLASAEVAETPAAGATETVRNDAWGHSDDEALWPPAPAGAPRPEPPQKPVARPARRDVSLWPPQPAHSGVSDAHAMTPSAPVDTLEFGSPPAAEVGGNSNRLAYAAPLVPLDVAAPLASAEFDAAWPAALAGGDPTIRSPRVTKIPLRLAPSEPACFGPQDILLGDGDIVFIESREPDYFYTGGLLGTGQFELPRDYDVDVLDAISIAEGRRARMTFQYPPNMAIGGVSALNQDVTVGASKVVVQRTLANGCLVNIEVDLHRALRDPNERIVIRPGDRLILRYTCTEAVAAFFERRVLESALIGISSGLTFGN